MKLVVQAFACSAVAIALAIATGLTVYACINDELEALNYAALAATTAFFVGMAGGILWFLPDRTLTPRRVLSGFAVYVLLMFVVVEQAAINCAKDYRFATYMLIDDARRSARLLNPEAMLPTWDRQYREERKRRADFIKGFKPAGPPTPVDDNRPPRTQKAPADGPPLIDLPKS